MRRAIPMAILAGAVFVVITPPRPLFALQWVAWVPLLLVLDGKSPKRDFLLGWVMGIAANLVLCSWLATTASEFGGLPFVVGLLLLLLFVLYSAIPYGLLALAVPRVRRWAGPWHILAVPAVWVAIELVFPLLFPWYQGSHQFRWLGLLQLASVTGVYGISYLVLAVNLAVAALARAAMGRDRWPVVPAAVVGAVFVAVVVWGALRVDRLDRALAEAPSVRMGLVQSNLGVEERHDLGNPVVLQHHLNQTDEAIHRGATLVLWGEGASPYTRGTKWAQIEGFVADRDVDLIIGGVRRETLDGVKHKYNSALALTPESAAAGQRQVYDKLVLIPFGEYMPFSGVFPGLAHIAENLHALTPGEGPSTLRFDGPDGELGIAPLICYEGCKASVARRQAGPDTDVLINLSHDAWFGDTIFPHQFLMVVVPRATEHGVSVVRVANTGVSAVIDATGRVRTRSALFEQTVLVEDVPVRRFATVYSRIGNLFAWLCVAASLAIAGTTVFVHRRGKRDDVRVNTGGRSR